MNTQRKEPKSYAEIAFGFGLMGLGYWLWPEGSAYAQQWIASGLCGFLGGVTVLKGTQTFQRELKVKRDREAAALPSGTYGNARFAGLDDLQASGLTHPAGLFLGAQDGVPLFYDGKAHLLTVAPARQGKGITVVIPNLLHFQGSVFITDPKGELAAVTAAHRAQTFGQKVIVLNPWGLHGLPQHRFNPLQGLVEAAADEHLRRGLIEDASAIALQLVPEPNDAKNRYFREGSRKILRALMLHFATRGQPEKCTLPELWRTIQNVTRLKDTLIAMAGSEALHGVVADFASDLSAVMADTPEQFGDFREGAAQAVSIFDPNGYVGESVMGSDFSFRELKTGKVSIYLVIPPDRIATHGAWLGLLTKQAIDAVGRTQGSSPVLFMLDEFANMGKLAGLAESLTALPGLGVRVWMIVQELADLRRVYGRETTETIASQAEVKQFFAVQNPELAKALSSQLGTRTMKTKSFNLGREADDQVGETLGETGRPLLSADEIRQLPAIKQLLLVKSLPPVLADKVAFWDVAPWNHWAAPNPVEGAHPQSKPLVTLTYQKKEEANV
ncbi:type IV secretory system conjugative DNA transfer family protein [Methyloligella solikamskensis]|uniref:Type IV secretory system conjugative DNA transfer family protein n=1 Tax=Methyloligella solikamskensis TaxID=1177756 RepID=A0ABW3J9X9_9HYPH